PRHKQDHHRQAESGASVISRAEEQHHVDERAQHHSPCHEITGIAPASAEVTRPFIPYLHPSFSIVHGPSRIGVSSHICRLRPVGTTCVVSHHARKTSTAMPVGPFSPLL